MKEQHVLLTNLVLSPVPLKLFYAPIQVVDPRTMERRVIYSMDIGVRVSSNDPRITTTETYKQFFLLPD